MKNAAARLISGAIRPCHHITRATTVALASCPATSEYRVARLVHQSLSVWSDTAPAHLADDMKLVADSGRHLRSAVDRTRVIPRTHHTFGVKSFAAGCGTINRTSTTDNSSDN